MIEGGLVTLLTLSTFLLPISSAQSSKPTNTELINPRVRVIVDNDFGGDPDGLFQLAHHLLSPSVEVRGIIGSHHYESGFYGYSGSSANARSIARELLKVMDLEGRIPVYEGANPRLKDVRTPVESEAARFIVKEAMRTDVKTPLYISPLVGASLC